MNANQFVTGKVRFSFCHLFKPYSGQPGQAEKYSVTCLLPKTDADTMNRINAAIEAAKQIGVQSKWGGKMPPVVAVPIYDGDGVRPNGETFGEECRGHYVFTASANTDHAPEVVDANGNPIINQSDIYSGCYGRVQVNVFPYDASGKRGVGFGLGPVQKLEDGEPLGGGRVTAAEAFGIAPQPQIDPITGGFVPLVNTPLPFN